MAGTITAFISTPLLLNSYGETKFGLLVFVLSFNLLIKLLDSGFSVGSIKFYSLFRIYGKINRLRSSFGTTIRLYIVLGLLNMAVFLFISLATKTNFNFTNQESILAKRLFLVLASSIPFLWVMNGMEQLIKSYEMVSYVQIALIIQKILMLCAVVLAVFYGWELTLYFIAYSIALVSPLILYSLRVKKILGISVLKLNFSLKEFKLIGSYSLKVLSFTVLQFSVNYFRPIILGLRSDISNVAYYRILENFGALFLAIGGAILNLLIPTLSRVLIERNIKLERYFVYQGTKYLSYLTSIMVFAFLLSSKEILRLYLGTEYDFLTTDLNIWVLTLLSIHNYILSSIILVRNRFRSLLIFNSIAAPISLLTCWVIAPSIGLRAAVVSLLVYQISMIIFMYAFYYKKILLYNSNELFLKSFLIPTIKIMGVYFCILHLRSIILINSSPVIQILISQVVFLSISLFVFIFSLSRIEREKMSLAFNKFR